METVFRVVAGLAFVWGAFCAWELRDDATRERTSLEAQERAAFVRRNAKARRQEAVAGICGTSFVYVVVALGCAGVLRLVFPGLAHGFVADEDGRRIMNAALYFGGMMAIPLSAMLGTLAKRAEQAVIGREDNAHALRVAEAMLRFWRETALGRLSVLQLLARLDTEIVEAERWPMLTDQARRAQSLREARRRSEEESALLVPVARELPQLHVRRRPPVPSVVLEPALLEQSELLLPEETE